MRKPELLAPGGVFFPLTMPSRPAPTASIWAQGVFGAQGGGELHFGAAAPHPRHRQGAEPQGVLALNTVVREEEIGPGGGDAVLGESLGLDGMIVQDLGIYELARTHFPRIPLHASTQMAVHNSAGLEGRQGAWLPAGDPVP